jgi:uncharacterized lipoprotein YajG
MVGSLHSDKVVSLFQIVRSAKMKNTLKIITTLMALNFLAACATTTPEHHTAQESAVVWEVSETPFLRAVKKNINGEKAQDVTSQSPVKNKETKTR